jgi:hypothetical protein
MLDDFCHILLLDLPGVNIEHKIEAVNWRFVRWQKHILQLTRFTEKRQPFRYTITERFILWETSVKLSHPQGGLSGGGNPCILNADILSYSPSENPFVGVS